MELSRTSVNLARAGLLAFGVLLWTQVPAAALSRELAYAQIDLWRVFLYLLPLVLLLAGVLARNPILTLLLFPTSIAVALAINPDDIGVMSQSATSHLLSVLTLSAYVVSASAWLQGPSSPSFLLLSKQPVHLKRDRWHLFRGYFRPRALLLVLAFALTAAAIPLFRPLLGRVTASFVDSADASSIGKGIVLTNLAVFFAWCILAYGLFIIPALERERQIRHVELEMQASIHGVRTWRHTLGLALTLWVGIGLLVILVLLRYR